MCLNQFKLSGSPGALRGLGGDLWHMLSCLAGSWEHGFLVEINTCLDEFKLSGYPGVPPGDWGETSGTCCLVSSGLGSTASLWKSISWALARYGRMLHSVHPLLRHD